ncbi:MAG: helix-turn-helix domain-containing protein [Candidatus Omnitrophota bacterium]|nr:helix-turn-helix domain-containing protein [Candidatus Omnitrophota bacterium]
MSEEKLLTVRDVASLLGVFEKDVLDLAQKGAIPAYKIGGVYLRFRQDQVEAYKKTLHAQSGSQPREKGVFLDKLRDFFYFNDFYILAGVLIFLLGFFIYRGL